MVDRVIGLRCLNCGAEYPVSRMFEGCPKCATDKFISNLTVVYDYDTISKLISKDLFLKRSRLMGVWRFKELLPVKNEKFMITLGEGNTPLLKCKNLEKLLGLRNLYIKDESRNPTWSYKDRLCSWLFQKGWSLELRLPQ